MTTHYLQHGVEGKRKDRRDRRHIPFLRVRGCTEVPGVLC